jgi:hypothetical protein
MKTLLLGMSVAALFLSACAKGPDVPPPKFSSQIEARYNAYLSGRFGDPVAFAVSEDGKDSYMLICPSHADRCIDVSSGGGTISKIINNCEQNADTPCHVYARGKRVVWN